MNREVAEKKLKQTFGIDSFYDEQWKTIDLLFQGERVLLIEKTGFGKSLCFQFPATQFKGITIVFSPLIALMRDQVESLKKIGISASFINSEQSPEEQSQTIQDAINGKLKLLYIAPERQENQEWIKATRKMNLSMIVIDEAHTISVWGHDFRPAFRRIINLIRLLPIEMPVLATTATATKRVQFDIEKQISQNITTLRGQLIRENFNLFVIKVNSEDEKLIWIAENLNNLKGTGIIYIGTRVNTNIYSHWLESLNIKTTNYNAGLEGIKRKEVEKGLMDNKWKAVISTNALGMGIDKPDIRFLIHTQIPSSPIHYYQEIGRAGRDGKPTIIILFYNSSKDINGIEEDYKLPKSFIDGGRPSLNKYNKVINALKNEQLREGQMMRLTNLKQTQIRVIKADLMEQGIIKEVLDGRLKKYEYQFDAPKLNYDTFDEIRKMKLNELDSMLEYVNLTTSRMKFLCEYLGDVNIDKIENCDNTNCQKYISNPQTNTKQSISKFKNNFFPELNVKNKGLKFVDGIAGSYYGLSKVGESINKSKYQNGGDFPDYLLKLTVNAFNKKFKEEFDLILYVPPTESGDLVKNFAEKLSKLMKIPLSHNLVKNKTTKPQKVFENSYLKKDNVAGVFIIKKPLEIYNKKVIIFDDIFDSGATIKEIGKVLTKHRVKKIVPLTIARTVGGDIYNK